jgi:hypothetical protein
VKSSDVNKVLTAIKEISQKRKGELKNEQDEKKD